MNDEISRRRLLEWMLAAGGALALAPLAAAEPRRIETPSMTMGPFYPSTRPADQDFDLTRLRGRTERAAGQVIDVRGRVLNVRGEPVRNARVEIWQTNTHGRYAHPRDRNTGAPLDPNFQGFGAQLTDEDGNYRFLTIKPAAYGDRGSARPPHIHFDIQGEADRKVTQMFFPNEPLNEEDGLLQSARNRETLIARVERGTGGVLQVTWDIVLARG